MFTGLVEECGVVSDCAARPGQGGRLAVAAQGVAAGAAPGDSVAVNGACLTVVAVAGDELRFDVSVETLACTTLGALQAGGAVNLERALRAGDPLGGHFVTGHVDGVGTVEAASASGDGTRLSVAAPAELARYIAVKGSICVDGVSLTVNAVDGARFEAQLIPYTLEKTNMSDLAPRSRVNLEVDLIARYVERLRDAA